MTKNNYSFTINKEQKNVLLQHNSIKALSTNNQYIEHLLKLKDVIITIYQTQKCVIQGTNIEEVKLLLGINQQSNYLPINFTKKMVGCDEVGVGDYFGGLVVCAAYIDNTHIDQVLALGIKDSKKLTDKQINDIAPQLIQLIPYQITEITPSKYNQLYDLYCNGHIIKTILHQSTLNQFITNLKNKQITIDKVILDQYVSQNKYNDYLKQVKIPNDVQLPMEFVTHSEQDYVCVACASIIARYYFLQQIQNLSDHYHLEIPLGSWNNKIEYTCKQIIERLKNTDAIDLVFKQLVKWHFNNTKKIKMG